jgi:hypothetical protein
VTALQHLPLKNRDLIPATHGAELCRSRLTEKVQGIRVIPCESY